MLVLGEKHGAKVWPLLDDDEIRVISLAMSQLGSIDSAMVEQLINDFVSRMSSSGAVTGDFDRTENLLAKLLGVLNAPAASIARAIAAKIEKDGGGPPAAEEAPAETAA